MHRIYAISQTNRNNHIEKKSTIPFSNLSYLPILRSNSFLNILLDNFYSELSSPIDISRFSISPDIQAYFKSSEIKGINNFEKYSYPQKSSNTIPKVTRNFNQKLWKKDSENISLSNIVPSQSRISSLFGWRSDPFSGKKAFHKGIDISAPKGTPIFPIQPGIIEEVGNSKSYGNYIKIRHEDGTVSLYAHNEKNLVKKGDTVNTSTQIASVGDTGRATGPHLHLEIIQNGKSINPQTYIKNLQYAEKKHHIETYG